MPKFFSGFALRGEGSFFEDYRSGGEFVVSGFSYGAIMALEYALSCGHRVDLLQLFSPAYFEDKNEEFKRAQLFHYSKNHQKYIENFLENISKRAKLGEFISEHKKEELQKLLYFQWEAPIIEALAKNIKIEVYLGGEDKIISALSAMEFFKCFGEVYYIKRADHLLQITETK